MNDADAAPLSLDVSSAIHKSQELPNHAPEPTSDKVDSANAGSSPRRNRDRQRNADSSVDRSDPSGANVDSEAETIIQSSREELSPEKRRSAVRLKQRGDGKARPENDTKRAPPSPQHLSRKRKRPENENVTGAVVYRNASGRGSPSKADSPLLELTGEMTEDQAVDSIHRSSPPSHNRFTGDARNSSSRKRSDSEDVARVGGREPDRKEGRELRLNTPDGGSYQDAGTESFVRRSLSERSTSPNAQSDKGSKLVRTHASNQPQKSKKAQSASTEVSYRTSEDRESLSPTTTGSPAPTLPPPKSNSYDHPRISPVKQTHRTNRRDQNGRTRLARACAAHEIDAAKARHAERPEDLNIPDNAGNTPLQIAALEGSAEIVKFLVGAGCDINTRNIDKDTPLIDAVENGHLEVVKLLLDAGANPRAGNAEGDEPYELVPTDSEYYEEIRKVIAEAKARDARRRKSDDHAGRATSGNMEPSSAAASAPSPRESPPAHTRSPPPIGFLNRRRTVRSEATRNDLLWTKPSYENLRDFAAKGDLAGVANILNVLQKADTKSIIAAAKGGHDEVLGILLGMGDPDPNPEPLQSGNHKVGHDTPMLAAIGRGNLAVVQLLLEQRGFDATRRDYRGRTYYEVSRERKGDNWEKEHDLLKQAYDTRINRMKSGRKLEVKSSRLSRENQRDLKKSLQRKSSSPAGASQRKLAKSPEAHRRKEKLHRGSGYEKADIKRQESSMPSKEKRSKSIDILRKPPRGDDKVKSIRIGPSDSDGSLLAATKGDLSVPFKKRSESILTSKVEQHVVKRRRLIAGRPPPNMIRRQESMASVDSVSTPEAHVSVDDDQPDPASLVDKVASSLKRSRESISPGGSVLSVRRRSQDDVSEEKQKKKRRIRHEDERGRSQIKTEEKGINKPKEPQDMLPERVGMEASKTVYHMQRTKYGELGKDSTETIPASDPAVSVKQEEQDLWDHDRTTKDLPPSESPDDSEAHRIKAKEEEEARAAMEAKEAEEKKAAAAVAERERLEKEAREAREAEEAREAAEALERAARLAQEKAEEERRRHEMEMRRIRQAEEERQMRLEQERLRLARLRKEQEEQEQRRRDSLPTCLCIAANLIGSSDPRAKAHAWLKKFLPILTATTRQLDPSCEMEVENDRWVPNYLVSPLLGTNDLQLSQYASWEKRAATQTQKENLWRVSRRVLIQEDALDIFQCTVADIMRKDIEVRQKFFAMEHIFWVKLSDFMDIVPHIGHLHDLEIECLRIHIDPERLPPDVQGQAVQTPKSNLTEAPMNVNAFVLQTEQPQASGIS